MDPEVSGAVQERGQAMTDFYKGWHKGMTTEQSKDLAYWERNMLALRVADGWYNDDEWFGAEGEPLAMLPRFEGWRRVLTCFGGTMCFHIPDDFDVGNLPQVARNWDGHSTEQKWRRVAEYRGIECPS
jgi:hypothetical protein